MPTPSEKHKGWFRNIASSRLEALYNGTRALHITATTFVSAVAATFDSTLAVTGATNLTGLLTAAGGLRIGVTGAGKFGLGTPEAVTIASGVATVTRPIVVLDAEGAGTTDTLDSITYSGQAAGDLLLLLVNATDTITADNSATLILGAATRAIAPGGSLLLVATSATVWQEVAFLTAAS